MAAPPRAIAGLRVLVTGASSGIGAATSILLAGQGAAVAGSGRDGSALANLAGGGCFTTILPRDLTEPGAPESVVESATAALGGLDVLVSCAGVGWSGPLHEMTAEELDALVDINFRATLHL
ncbi:MAG TPA: SDR family oxidoreductase, partial [Acidimicrobiales bacterium]|nr:SDR family oxidoreductase [Acidimicrobiales bacterium]